MTTNPSEPTTKRGEGPFRTFLLDSFDLALYRDDSGQGVALLHSRFAGWLRSVEVPLRFVCWVMPASLDDKISRLSATARAVTEADPTRSALLMEYRRHFETLAEQADYQRAVCGIGLNTYENTAAVARVLSSTFDVAVRESQWPALFTGQYEIRTTPFGHWQPVGRPGGRLLWAILESYEFLPTDWNFFKPARELLSLNLPMALAVDIPQTYERLSGIEAVENNIMAHQAHLAGLRGAEDSRAVQKIHDCRATLEELNQGDQLHKVRLCLAVAAPDLKLLKERVGLVVSATRQWFRLRQENGELLRQAVSFFAPVSSKAIHVPDSSWRVTSRQLAFLFAPLGYRKLSETDGVLRGVAVEGGYPVFHNSWKDKRATHEVWVGMSGYGKTFMLNCYLLREYAENGIPFDLLEPMGHGRHLANAIGIPAYSLSARSSTLNPQDIVFASLIEQKSHVIRLYETILGRPMTGGQQENLERGLLSEALDRCYKPFPDLQQVEPTQVPLCEDVVDILSGLGDGNPRRTQLARELAEELGGLCTGSGPWARFLNGATNMPLSRAGRERIGPRVFMFHEMSDDPILLAIAYTQVLGAIRRDSLMDEQPRIIAVDEVYRLSMYPSLTEFLVEAAKTFRTRRKKLICVDQNLIYFLQGKMRFVFENSPIRVIFNQGPGINVFKEDGAFGHFNSQHLQTIATLNRFHYLLDIHEGGTSHILSTPSLGEYRRFGMT